MEFIVFNERRSDLVVGGVPNYDDFLYAGTGLVGIKKASWIERFQSPGEFSFETPISLGIMSSARLKSFISHTRTGDVMIVENHEAKTDSEGKTTVATTGRSFESYLDFRVIDEWWSNSSTSRNYSKPVLVGGSWTPQDQILALLNAALGFEYQEFVDYDNDVSVRFVELLYGYVFPDIPDSEPQEVEFGPLLPIVLNLLKKSDLGIKCLRPGYFHPGPYVGDPGGPEGELIYPGKPKIAIEVHSGEDKTDSVVFSHSAGDIAKADYLWSSKTEKNAYLVVSKWFTIMVLEDGSTWWAGKPKPDLPLNPTGYNRRTGLLNVAYLDEAHTTIPSGSTKTAIVNKMKTAGQQALMTSTSLIMTSVEVSENCRWTYREDYNIGDYVKIEAEHGVIAVAQVVEYAETLDLEGERGHPTLRILE